MHKNSCGQNDLALEMNKIRQLLFKSFYNWKEFGLILFNLQVDFVMVTLERICFEILLDHILSSRLIVWKLKFFNQVLESWESFFQFNNGEPLGI